MAIPLVTTAILFVIGVPVAFSLIGGSLGYFCVKGITLAGAAERLVMGIDSFVLLAVPFFILTAELMNACGISDQLFHAAGCLVRHIPGGLGHVNVVSSMIFAGMSGSAIADTSSIGILETEAMVKRGFDRPFSAAVTAASSTIGPVIPPSIPFVVYGALTGTSVGALFLGGFIPGVLIGIVQMIIVYLVSLKRSYPIERRATLRECRVAFTEAFLPLLTPAILMGGIVGGFFTPTEAAAMAAAYSLFLGVVVYHKLGLRELGRVLFRVAMNTGLIMLIAAGAMVLSWVLSIEQVPQRLVALLTSLTSNKTVILVLINVALLIIGCFMEALPSMLILTPMFLPLLKTYGIDPVPPHRRPACPGLMPCCTSRSSSSIRNTPCG